MASEPGTDPIAEAIRATLAGTNGHVVFRAEEVAELLAEHDGLADELTAQTLRAEQALAAIERAHVALRLIAGSFECEVYTSGPGSCWQAEPRTADARYTADRWCDACTALAVLQNQPIRLGGGITLQALGAPLPAGVDWTADDEAGYTDRKAAGFPASYYEDPGSAGQPAGTNRAGKGGHDAKSCLMAEPHLPADPAPSFRPVAATQFVSGYQATKSEMEADR